MTEANLKDNVELVEALAEFLRQQWCGWMECLFQHGELNTDGNFTIQQEYVGQWKRQLKTSYADLPESGKKVIGKQREG